MPRNTARDEELSTRPALKKRLTELCDEVTEGFISQNDRADDILDNWDINDCKLSGHQYYQGNAKIFVPIVPTAVKARVTRFVNQLFPQSGRNVECITENGDIPHATVALLEHYIRKANLRTLVAPPLFRNGDIEGQLNVYVGWHRSTRHTVYRETRDVEIAGADTGHKADDIVKETIFDEYPTVEVLADTDVLVLPATADSVDAALDVGGSVSIRRKWTKSKFKQMIRDGEIMKDAGDAIVTQLAQISGDQRSNIQKEHAKAAGIHPKDKLYWIIETWTKLKVDGIMRLCRCYLGAGDQKVLGCKLNPYWCDRCPILSVPIEKVAGTFKGVSPVNEVRELQYYANDITNEAADSATFSMLPIVMTDPLKNPKIGTMVLDLAAVWETNPASTSFASFPQLWKDGFGIIAAIKQEIYQSLSVSPAMMPQQTGQRGNKRNQAEVALEQQVDVLTTADAVTIAEEGIFTPIVERFAEYDAQFRNVEISIKAFGQMGLRTKMERIPPLQMGNRYSFRWFGVEAARNAAQIQQQIAGMNVLRGIPPQLYQGRRLDLVPLIESLVENAFGPRLAPLVFKDERSNLSLDPDTENAMLRDGYDIGVSPFDNDAKHVQSHMAAAQALGDPTGMFRVHIIKHQMQMAAKQQQMGPQSPGAPGTPGQPGVAGVPRPGGQVANPRQAMQPAGRIAPDSMPRAGAVTMPRKM